MPETGRCFSCDDGCAQVPGPLSEVKRAGRAPFACRAARPACAIGGCGAFSLLRRGRALAASTMSSKIAVRSSGGARVVDGCANARVFGEQPA